MIGGMFGSYNVALAWISSTFARPRAKRAAAYATINSLGNSAFLAKLSFLSTDKQSPKFGLHTYMTRSTVLGTRWVKLYLQ